MASRSIREEITAIAEKYADLVKEEMNVEAVYLFGSFVNGNHDQDSDIDIAVIADDFSGDISDNLRYSRQVLIRKLIVLSEDGEHGLPGSGHMKPIWSTRGN